MAEAKSFHLFLVEDDLDVQTALSSYLELEGFQTTTSADGDEAVHMLRSDPNFDLILLDVMLPNRNGFEVLREARGMGIRTPVVMLTAKDQQEEVLKGFELGADDYVPKPFSADVLRSRIKAILSRTKPPADQPMDIHHFGEITVNFTSNEAERNGEPIAFTALEFDLLRYLITNRGRVVSRAQLLREVWKLPETVDTRTVDRHVASLRKKIEPDREEPRHIHTVYGRGYRFEL